MDGGCGAVDGERESKRVEGGMDGERESKSAERWMEGVELWRAGWMESCGWRVGEQECGAVESGGWRAGEQESGMDGERESKRVELWRAVDVECGKMDGERVRSCGVRWM